jgi:putative transcriptional regulator
MENKFEIKSNSLEPGSGKILVSEPLLQDNYFSRSVILLIEHNEDEGSVGVILNKPMQLKFNEIITDAPILNSEMYLGGPVSTGNVYFLHTLGNQIENTIEVLPGLFWGGDIEQVNELIKLGVLQSSNIRFYIGYSGWEPLQLQEELKKNSWAITNAGMKEIWQMKPIHLWQSMVSKLGKNYNFWKTLPENPELN